MCSLLNFCIKEEKEEEESGSSDDNDEIFSNSKKVHKLREIKMKVLKPIFKRTLCSISVQFKRFN